MYHSFKAPVNVCFRLNRECNLACEFCLASLEKEELSLNNILYAIDYLKDHGMQSVRLAGGEPTLRKDLLMILEHCCSLGLRTIVCSNLYDVDNIMDGLKKYPVSITTSIHGNEEFHNRISGRECYQITTSRIRELISCGKEVNMHYTLMRKNVEFAESVVQNAIEWGVKKITFQTLIPRERGECLFCQNEDRKEIIRCMEQIYPLKKKYEKNIKVNFNNLYKKYYYVFETDGNLYLQKYKEADDILIRRIV